MGFPIKMRIIYQLLDGKAESCIPHLFAFAELFKWGVKLRKIAELLLKNLTFSNAIQ